MVLDMGNYLSQLLNVWRLQVNQVESDNVVLQRPEVDSQIIGGEEVLSVWRHTH